MPRSQWDSDRPKQARQCQGWCCAGTCSLSALLDPTEELARDETQACLSQLCHPALGGASQPQQPHSVTAPDRCSCLSTHSARFPKHRGAVTRFLGFVPLGLGAVPVHLHASCQLLHRLQHLPALLLLGLVVQQQLLAAAAPEEGVGPGQGRWQRFVVLLPACAPATAEHKHAQRLEKVLEGFAAGKNHPPNPAGLLTPFLTAVPTTKINSISGMHKYPVDRQSQCFLENTWKSSALQHPFYTWNTEFYNKRTLFHFEMV